jgi:diguanylate cyclase (GGDEF)-like protein/PAS domain S-box-containing protein
MESSAADRHQSITDIIAHQENIFAALLQNNPAATIITDLDALVLTFNPAFELMFGYNSAEISGKNIDNLITNEETYLEATNYTRRVLQMGETVRANGIRSRKDKSRIDVEIRGIPILENHTIIGMVSFFTDLTLNKRTEETLRDFHNSFVHVMDSIDADVYVADMETFEILFMNKHIRDSFGGNYIGQTCWQVFHRDKNKPCDHCTNKFLLDQTGKTTGDYVWEAKNFITNRWYKNSDRAIRWDDGRYVRLEVATDITNLKETEVRLEYLATHDSLTNLPNRNLFNDRLHHALRLAQRTKFFAAVFFLDLDGFKVVNDKLGHLIGDLLLKGVAERLKLVLRDADTIGRMAGDEYAVILEKVTHPEDTLEIAEKVIKAISEPFFFEGNKVIITASLGISIFPEDGKDVEGLLKKADEAMYVVKARGKNGYQRANPI